MYGKDIGEAAIGKDGDVENNEPEGGEPGWRSERLDEGGGNKVLGEEGYAEYSKPTEGEEEGEMVKGGESAFFDWGGGGWG